MMRTNRFISFLTALALGTALVGCARSASAENTGKHVVKIAYLPITHALPVFEAAEELKASDDDLQVELVKYGSWPELLDALNTGRVDGASVLIELAMKSKQEGIGIKAVALGHKDGNVVITSKDVQTAADLKGKTFAIPHRQSSHNILLHDTLAKGGLTEDDITITELAPPEMPSALASGQIDGYCVAEPFGAKAVSLDVGQVLYTSEELWEDSLCCGLVLTDSFLDSRSEDAAHFVESYKTAGKNLNPDKAKSIAETYLQQDPAVLDLSLKWIRYDDLEITEDTYQVLCDKVKTYGLSDNPPSYTDFVKNDF
jgi:NitT/TauT family transport system substrate-binding protein